MDVAQIMLGVAIGVGFAAVLVGVMAVGRAGSLGRASWGLTVAGRANMDPAFAAKVDELLGVAAPPPKPASPPPPPKPSARRFAYSLLQTEARLLDFLMEDVSAASDEQIGQAVRKIHGDAQRVLKQHVVLDEIYPSSMDTVTVPKGFDPSAVRVVGNVTGEPPFTGRLEHPGWKAREVKLPPVAQGQDPFVIQPAEVQLG